MSNIIILFTDSPSIKVKSINTNKEFEDTKGVIRICKSTKKNRQ